MESVQSAVGETKRRERACPSNVSNADVWLNASESGRQVLVERDAKLFEQLTEPWAKPGGVAVRQIHVDVSCRCDLKCPICYYPKANPSSEISLKQVEETALKYKGCAFVLGGREPTMRKDLDAVIRTISPHGSVLILTHGLKLADRDYLESLRQAGLDGVILSFNGMNDDAYLALNGKAFAEKKREVLRTLKQSKTPTILSMAVSRGVNDDQVGQVSRLCQDNTDFIKELRIRAVRPLGRREDRDEDLLVMSDMLELFCAQTGFKKENVMKGIGFWHQLGRVFNVDAYRPRLCTVEFMIRRRGAKWYSEGEIIDRRSIAALENWPKNKWKRPMYLSTLLWQMVRIHGFKPVVKRVWLMKNRLMNCTVPSHRQKLYAVEGCNDLLQITLKSWPNPSLHLLTEQHKCGTLYVSETECSNFCAKNIHRQTQS